MQKSLSLPLTSSDLLHLYSTKSPLQSSWCLHQHVDVHILFNSHLSEDHVKIQIFTIQTSVLQPVCSQEPVSPEIMPSLPQSTRRGLDFTCCPCPCWCESLRTRTVHCSKGRNWGKTLPAIKYQLQYGRTRVPRLLRNVGTCLRLNKERSRIARPVCSANFLLGLY